MNIEKFLAEKDKQITKQNYIEFNADELNELKVDASQFIIDYFHGNALMKIPESEIAFFEWLKVVDRPVWDDLWGDQEDLYLVSINFLNQFLNETNGFPICDLIEQPNFWFTARHIKPKGMEELSDILLKFKQQKKLTVYELFLFEISIAQTDIWHFCYRHKLKINTVKSVIEELVFKGWLVHLPNREDLIKYIDI